MDLSRFAVRNFNKTSALQWIGIAGLALGGCYLIVTSVRWVATPRTRTPRFRNLAASPPSDRIIFVLAVATYAGGGFVLILTAVVSAWTSLGAAAGQHP